MNIRSLRSRTAMLESSDTEKDSKWGRIIEAILSEGLPPEGYSHVAGDAHGSGPKAGICL